MGRILQEEEKFCMKPKEFFKKIIEIRNADRSLFKTERWLSISEVFILYTLIQEHSIKNYIECGTANGYSTVVAAYSLLNKLKWEQKNWVSIPYSPTIRTFDIIDRPKVWNLSGLEFIKDKISFVQKDFTSDLAISRSSLIFIDGDHSLAGVTRDWEAVESLISSDDIVLFHDVITEIGVARLINTLSTKYEIKILNSERGFALLRLR